MQCTKSSNVKETVKSKKCFKRLTNVKKVKIMKENCKFGNVIELRLLKVEKMIQKVNKF